jgi:type I restriction enzyme S subunit
MRKMKDSGIEWIGKIPEGWEVIKLRHIFTFRTGLTITRAELQETGIPCINYGEIHSKYNFELDILRNELKCVDEAFLERNGSSVLETGDIVFCDTSEDIDGSGNCVYISNTANKIVLAGSHTIIARPVIMVNSRYLAYLFLTSSWRRQIRSVVTGIKVFSITQSILKATKAILPPLNIQNKICDYLDHICAKIDSLIKAKETTNEKLKEYRQSVIYEAVTKGLDKNTKMKDSGIEWIGEMPEEWETRKLKYSAQLCIEKTEKYDIEMIYIGLEHVESGTGKLIHTYEPIYDFNGDTLKFKKGDVLFGKLRPYLAKCYQASFDGKCSSEFLVIRPYFNSGYLNYSMLTKEFINFVDGSTYGVKMPRAEWSFIGNIRVPIPPAQEQQQIADYLDRKCADIDSIIAANQNTINKLKEYRQSVIYEAVTGKVEI